METNSNKPSSEAITISGIQTKKSFLNDTSLWILLIVNLATIFFAIKNNWDVIEIMWVYWFQAATVGFFNFIRILGLKEFSTTGIVLNGHTVEESRGTKNFSAFFFFVHYGLFSLVSFVFLFFDSFRKTTTVETAITSIKYVLLTSLLFFLNHLFSYIYNRKRDTKKQNIGVLMFYPYLRIMPMFITMVLGSTFTGALPFILILKTLADLIMHFNEHEMRKQEVPEL